MTAQYNPDFDPTGIEGGVDTNRLPWIRLDCAPGLAFKPLRASRESGMFSAIVKLVGGTSTGKTTFLNAMLGEIPRDRLNVDGGAISLGHPVGTSGNRITLHLANAMGRLGLRRGIATECIGGGQGGAMMLEAV